MTDKIILYCTNTNLLVANTEKNVKYNKLELHIIFKILIF